MKMKTLSGQRRSTLENNAFAWLIGLVHDYSIGIYLVSIPRLVRMTLCVAEEYRSLGQDVHESFSS